MQRFISQIRGKPNPVIAIIILVEGGTKEALLDIIRSKMLMSEMSVIIFRISLLQCKFSSYWIMVGV